MQPVRVTVLLAAYQGEQYIEEQIRSILDTARPDILVDIIISDDSPGGSTARFVESLGLENITCSAHINTDRGYQNNFGSLCEYAKSETQSDYYCFADQDDVWHRDKLVALLPLFDNGHEELAQLVHSDLRVVNETLKPIAPSYINFQGLPPADHHHIPEFLHQNIVTGCAAIFNRSLLEVATPIPQCAVVHDHWLGICAEYFGRVRFSSKSLVDYRQHGENSIGATAFEAQQSYFQPHLYRILWTFPRHLAQAIEQAKALEHRRCQHHLPANAEDNALVTRFARLKETPYFERIKAIKVFFSGRRSIKERVYLHVVFALLPHLKVRRFEVGQ